MESFLLTKNELTTIINLQIQEYDLSRMHNQQDFDELKNLLLSKEMLQLCEQSDIDLDRILRKKAQDWLENDWILNGLSGFKQLFWNGYYRILIPIVIKHYGDLNTIQFKSKISEDGGAIILSKFLLTKYPQITHCLDFSAKSYQRYLIELERLNLKDKAGYKGNPDNITSFKGFSKSILVDIKKHIGHSEIHLLNINKQGMLKQKEIAQKLGISQQQVSKTLNIFKDKNRSGFRKI